MKTKDSTTYKIVDWMGFGVGSIATAVDSTDGSVTRIRPLHFDDRHTPEELNEWKVEARGHTFKVGMRSYPSMLSYAYKKRVDSPNRIPYPLRRVDWDPQGERNPQNRGKSGYVRINWDEAAQIVADEIARMKDTYGTTAIFTQADGHGEPKTIGGGHGCMTRLMDIVGPYTQQARQPDSWEGWYWGAKHMWGMEPVGRNANQTNLFKDVSENADTVLLWGCDPETTNEGVAGLLPCRMLNFWNEIGIPLIAIAPDFNYAAAAHADKWFPVLPNTDAALQLGIIHVWLTEGTYDREYIDTHTVGFDWLVSHVMGHEDGIEKTPAWAASKCGIPARRIKALARHWARHNVSICHGEGGSMIRSAYAHEPARLEVCLLAMQALGHPGRNVIHMQSWNLYFMSHLSAVPTSDVVFSFAASFTGHYVNAATMNNFIPQTLVPDAILGNYTEENPLTWYGKVICSLPRQDQYTQYSYPAPGASRIHMIWTDTPCWETCWNGGFKMQDALRSPEIECVVVQHPWFENDVNFGDVILPISTKLEQDDIEQGLMSGSYDVALNALPACEPYGESLSDFEAVMKVAEKMGLADALLTSIWGDCSDAEKINGVPYEKAKRFAYETSGLMYEGASMNPFAAPEEIADAPEPTRRAWVPDYDEFAEDGWLAVPFSNSCEERSAGLYDFWRDPEAHPLMSDTGKIEIYANALAEHWPDDTERKPYPRWIEQGETHPDERLTTPRGEEYPFLMVSNHPHYREHANMDDIPWLREAGGKVIGPDGYGYEPAWINPVDAAKLGIESGDIVRIYNERGGVLGGAVVTNRICEHAVLQDHGARVDTVVAGVGGLDRGGANNLIAPSATTSKNCVGEVTSGFLVNVEKVDVFELAKQYPEAFGRPFDEAYGLIANPHIIEEA
ncbi:MAG: molybdopterin-dependent oxidoreductase [Eggerthellaceae bacterium]|nr:molybdopterin-dependent oxidoreductase [Eggerthellaceae bacterium]